MEMVWWKGQLKLKNVEHVKVLMVELTSPRWISSGKSSTRIANGGLSNQHGLLLNFRAWNMFFPLLDWHWHKLMLNHLGFPPPNLKTILGARGVRALAVTHDVTDPRNVKDRWSNRILDQPMLLHKTTQHFSNLIGGIGGDLTIMSQFQPAPVCP